MDDVAPSQLADHPRHNQHNLEEHQINEMRCVFLSTQTYLIELMHLNHQIGIGQEFLKALSYQHQMGQQR